MKARFAKFALALWLLLAVAGPVSAAEAPGAAFGSYWHEFLDHWKKFFQEQNGVVMGVLGLGAVALFIITRGKWKK